MLGSPVSPQDSPVLFGWGVITTNSCGAKQQVEHAPIFKRFLEKIKPGKLEFTDPPESVTPIRIDANGFQVRDQEARDQESEERVEYFLLGTEPELATDQVSKP